MSVPLPGFCVINRSLCSVPSLPFMCNPPPSAAASVSDGLLRSQSACAGQVTVKELIRSGSHSDVVRNAVVTDVEMFLLSAGAGMQEGSFQQCWCCGSTTAVVFVELQCEHCPSGPGEAGELLSCCCCREREGTVKYTKDWGLPDTKQVCSFPCSAAQRRGYSS